MSRRIKPKSRESIQEAVDIIANSHDDESAIDFLRDTLEDDFPDLDLGRMDLHEAIGVLGGNDKKEDNKVKIENLSKSLGEFMKKQDAKNSPKKVEKKKKKRKRK